MENTLYKYEVYCNVESGCYESWYEDAPTKCPNCASSNIDLDKSSIIDEHAPDRFEIKEENIKTGGNFKTEGFELDTTDITASIGWKQKEISFPIQRTVMSAHFKSKAANDGDIVEMYVAEDTTTGSITSAVSVDDTVISVSQTVIDNTAKGYYVKLFDGSTTNDLGQVISFDEDNLTITVENAATSEFTASSPTTYIKQTVRMAENLHIDEGDIVEIGISKIGGSHLPAGKKIKARYYNSTAVAKKFHFKIDFLY